MLTHRQKEILRILIKSAQMVSIRELALAVQVSNRTIRYDLKDLSYALKPLNLNVSIVPSRGVSLENPSNPAWHKILDQSIEIGSQVRSMTLMLSLLLYPKISINAMSERFQVSRQTITRDISNLITTDLLDHNDINRSTHGISLNQNVEQQRNMYCKLMQKTDYIQIALTEIEKHFHEVNNKVSHWIEHVELSYGAEFEVMSKKYLRSVANYLSIKIVEINSVDGVLSSFLHSDEFGLYWDKDGIKRIEKAIMSSRLTKGTLPVETSPDFVEELIVKLVKTLRLPIQPTDDAYQSLKLHLLAATHRSKHNQQVDNPLKDDVRLSYSILYEAVFAVLKEFEEKHDLSFSENEVAFIVMHVASTIQSQSHLQSNINVAVVCQHGAATSNLLHSRLKLLMPNQNLLGPFSVSEFHKHRNITSFDLIISTIGLVDANVLVVNPLLSGKDIEMIERRLWNLLYQKQCDLLIKNFTVSHQKLIAMQELIKEKHIQLSDRFDDWQKAIEFAAKPLLDDGIIQQRYITKMIWAVESLGPYMVILPKIAFVHAGNEDGVIRNGISCLRMAQPLSFGSQKATDVQVIFVIASKAKEDMGLLRLVRIIENMDNYDRLINANDIKAILALEG
ncbi:MAG: PTS sugar transporter subunit IIA [Erysipelotrichaceae bacterium]|nr:PTS sugar transporter subunit IIA [Erysipelotrichaceae bacterium]